MKKLNFAIGFLIGFCLVIGFSIWQGYRFGEKHCNESWQVVADSMQAIAELPPDTLVVRDTIWPDTVKIQVPKPLPVPVQAAADTNRYQDTVVTEMFTLWIDDLVKGSLLDRSLSYKLAAPLIVYDSIKIFINKPYPVIKEPVPRSHWAVIGGVGGNYQGMGWSLGVMYLDKSNWIYGAEYLKVGAEGNVMLKVGYKF